MEKLKQCRLCPEGVLKPIGDFWVNRNGRTKDGLMSTCKDCTKVQRNEWAADNREKEAEWNRAKYLADPESFKRKAIAYEARKTAAFVEFVDPLVVLELADGVCVAFVMRTLIQCDLT